MKEIYQGETLNIKVTARDETTKELIDLTGAKAVLGYGIKDSDEVVTKPCTVSGSVVTVKLTPAETALMRYDYLLEIKVLDSINDVGTLWSETLRVKPSKIPNPTFV